MNTRERKQKSCMQLRRNIPAASRLQEFIKASAKQGEETDKKPD